MREIKFRVWHKKEKKMYQVQTFRFQHQIKDSYSPNGNKLIKDRVYLIGGDISGYWLQDIELMQFTGLLDKNGKEIYEGDILFVPDGTFEDKHGEHVHRGSTKVIEWSNDDAGYFNLPHRVWMCHHEIIGNIYENPELLKLEDL